MQFPFVNSLLLKMAPGLSMQFPFVNSLLLKMAAGLSMQCMHGKTNEFMAGTFVNFNCSFFSFFSQLAKIVWVYLCN